MEGRTERTCVGGQKRDGRLKEGHEKVAETIEMIMYIYLHKKTIAYLRCSSSFTMKDWIGRKDSRGKPDHDKCLSVLCFCRLLFSHFEQYTNRPGFNLQTGTTCKTGLLYEEISNV